MTTAHRPTWKAAVGRSAEGGWATISTQRSVLDQAAHTKLKLRAGPQQVDKKAALKASLLKLEEAEKRVAQKSCRVAKREVNPEIEEEGRMKLLKQTAEVDDERIRKKYDDADDGDGGDDGGGEWSDLDDNSGAGAEDESDLDESDSDLESSDDEDDEDEEAALQAELAKIRAEREAVKAKEDAEAAAEEQTRMEEAALMGNPLLASSATSSSGRLKRRWNDDVVFRNQARGESDQGSKKRFINDTIRNDFHKRFLNKFVR
mmetsp:Transcript_12273/g.17731  ORF Transcript_12273/g.17731 Transcript_12273/m.17731 type:complete len:261 (+) Transcript_12273:32-814(+)|eukprot:CAMPEP_0195514658 /NCGR_PEP_ID=MMETSP0794_2-20130614/5975_1 /TAXON_ID=515487 /ORGANISM="Stephanopyxis turris, Strain CCMP 815" /LENGTH=260 /DNA_ID=CAMNT_0040642941 /DNA_START=27 /DNA_END=809 /DNA_ORIENTATION=-